MTLFRDPGTSKFSITRVTVMMLATAACGLTGAVAKYMFTPEPSAAVIAAAGGVVTALVAAGCVAILNRTVADTGEN